MLQLLCLLPRTPIRGCVQNTSLLSRRVFCDQSSLLQEHGVVEQLLDSAYCFALATALQLGFNGVCWLVEVAVGEEKVTFASYMYKQNVMTGQPPVL